MALETGSVVFVDTNVLLAATDRERAGHGEARQVLQAASSHGLHLAVSGQIVREYLVVSTRPVASNGLGMVSANALSNVDAFLTRVLLYDETDAVCRRLRALVRDYGLAGVRIHDANIVATMLVHGVDTIVTENATGFAGFAGLQVLRLRELSDDLKSRTNDG
jgi:predicted nucleic acid-binding protein